MAITTVHSVMTEARAKYKFSSSIQQFPAHMGQYGLLMLFKEYDFVAKQVNESQTLYALDHYANIQGSPPIVLLRMKELVLKRQSQLVSLEHAAYQKYIKWLDLTGQLSETPLKNYLSVDLSSF